MSLEIQFIVAWLTYVSLLCFCIFFALRYSCDDVEAFLARHQKKLAWLVVLYFILLITYGNYDEDRKFAMIRTRDFSVALQDFKDRNSEKISDIDLEISQLKQKDETLATMLRQLRP